MFWSLRKQISWTFNYWTFHSKFLLCPPSFSIHDNCLLAVCYGHLISKWKVYWQTIFEPKHPSIIPVMAIRQWQAIILINPLAVATLIGLPREDFSLLVYWYNVSRLDHWKKKWCHFDLKKWVTGLTKIWPGIQSNWRIFESNWFSISSQFDSNMFQLLGIPGQILVPRLTQLFRSKWLYVFFQWWS